MSMSIPFSNATRYDYDPYGRRTKVSGSYDADFGYTGHFHEQPGWITTGVEMAMFRIYDPELGRWLSRDPIGERGGINLYGYVGNDSVNWIDPFGLYDIYFWAHVTAYGWGVDNSWGKNADGGDQVAKAIDPSRVDPSGTSHAHLGSGTYNDPTSLATQPDEKIPYGSRVYIEDLGWFVVEDRCARKDKYGNDIPKDTFDVWSDKSTGKERASLTDPSTVTVFGPKEAVPSDWQKKGPSKKWSDYYKQKHGSD